MEKNDIPKFPLYFWSNPFVKCVALAQAQDDVQIGQKNFVVSIEVSHNGDPFVAYQFLKKVEK